MKFSLLNNNRISNLALGLLLSSSILGKVHGCATENMTEVPMDFGRRLDVQSTDYLQVLQKCGSAEYEAAIFVETHFQAVLYPFSPSAARCPMIVYHLKFDDDNWLMTTKDDDVDNDQSVMKDEDDLTVQVVADVYPTLEAGELHYPPDQAFGTGTYTLDQVAQAVADLELPDGGAWDFLHNSCFAMATQMAVALHWDIGNGMLDYVSQRLRENHTNEKIQKAMKTRNFLKYFMDDEDGSSGANMNLEPLLRKTLKALIKDGKIDGLMENSGQKFDQGQVLLKFLANADPEKDEALAVFYDGLVESYVRRYIQPKQVQKK